MADFTRSHYTLGDQGPAAERLRRLDELYRPRSADSLDLAVDLDSGPGFTTKLVAEGTQAAQVIGFERSADFCSRPAASPRQPGPEELHPASDFALAATQRPGQIGRPCFLSSDSSPYFQPTNTHLAKEQRNNADMQTCTT